MDVASFSGVRVDRLTPSHRFPWNSGSNMKQNQKNVVLAIRFTLFLILTGLVWLLAFPADARAPSDAPVVAQNSAMAEVSVPASLTAYLQKLAFVYECVSGCQRALAMGQDFRIVDSNGLYSYGCLQFQEATWVGVNKQYGLDPWANGGIYSCDRQLDVAARMFEADPIAAANHWYTSIYKRGLGLPPN